MTKRSASQKPDQPSLAHALISQSQQYHTTHHYYCYPLTNFPCRPSHNDVFFSSPSLPAFSKEKESRTKTGVSSGPLLYPQNITFATPTPLRCLNSSPLHPFVPSLWLVEVSWMVGEYQKKELEAFRSLSASVWWIRKRDFDFRTDHGCLDDALVVDKETEEKPSRSPASCATVCARSGGPSLVSTHSV